MVRVSPSHADRTRPAERTFEPSRAPFTQPGSARLAGRLQGDELGGLGRAGDPGRRPEDTDRQFAVRVPLRPRERAW